MAALLWLVKNWRVALAVGLLVALFGAGWYVYRQGKANALQGVKLAEQAETIANLQRVLKEERAQRDKLEIALSIREQDYVKIESDFDGFRAKHSGMRVRVACKPTGTRVATELSGSTSGEEGSQRYSTRQFDLGEVAEDIGRLGRDYDKCVADFNSLSDAMRVK